MSNWREAKSLQTLEDEIQRYYPGTTTWEIGDDDHRNTWSDHNPNVCCDVVCGKDVLGNAGLDLQKFVDHLIANPHPNLRYVIFNHKIYERSNGFKPRDYKGKSGHETHVHVSTGNGPDGRSTGGYDDTSSWHLEDMGKAPSKPSKPSQPDDNDNMGDKMPTVRRGSKGHAVKVLQALLGIYGWKVSVDGIFGPQTEKALKAFQAKYAKPSDGIAGPITWGKLLGVK